MDEEQIFLQIQITNGNKYIKEYCSISSPQRNASQNHNEIPSTCTKVTNSKF